MHKTERSLLTKPILLTLYSQNAWTKKFVKQINTNVKEGITYRHTKLLVCWRMPTNEPFQPKLLVQQHGDAHQKPRKTFEKLKKTVSIQNKEEKFKISFLGKPKSF